MESLIQQQRDYFRTGVTRDLGFRRSGLADLIQSVERHEADILRAMRQDLGRPERESLLAEVSIPLSEARHARRRLRRWMRPLRRRTPWLAWPARAHVHREAFGVVAIFGPWNFPFNLVLTPLVGAIAGGNCVIVKPSEIAPHCAAVLDKILSEAFPREYVAVVQGDRDVGERLAQSPVDHIFFTGSTETGRAVMAAAAQNLTPVTLELGGKCPCIIGPDADIEIAARRVAWGKFINAGQTCVAPDFLLVHQAVYDPFLKHLTRAIADFFGPEYGKVINRRHFDRLVNLLGDGRIVCGGAHDADRLYIEPTVMTDFAEDSAATREEIFGPILPVRPFRDLDQALAIIGAAPAPLAVYLFTQDQSWRQAVVDRTRSGGVCINDVIVQIIGAHLPFGGVGASGMGTYHGKASFDAFTHQRTVVRRSTRPDFDARYPNARLSLNWARRLYRLLLRE